MLATFHVFLSGIILLSSLFPGFSSASIIDWHQSYNPNSRPQDKQDLDIHLEKSYTLNNKILVNIKDQQLYHINPYNMLIKQYPISSGVKGTGEIMSSLKTPRGWLEVEKKYGEGYAVSQHFKARQPVSLNTGITSRILTLKGLQSHNKNSINRNIYIHGSPILSTLGKTTASLGCIHMHPKDMKELFEKVQPGTHVYIYDTNNPLPWQPQKPPKAMI